MKKEKVIIIPTDDYFQGVIKTQSICYINKKLGRPRLEYHNVKYLAPYILNQNNRGVNQLFPIVKIDSNADSKSHIIHLGDPIYLSQKWNSTGGYRRFKYADLSVFNNFLP